MAYLLAYHVDGIVKNRIRDTLLSLEHKVIHETCNHYIMKLGIRK